MRVVLRLRMGILMANEYLKPITKHYPVFGGKGQHTAHEGYRCQRCGWRTSETSKQRVNHVCGEDEGEPIV